MRIDNDSAEIYAAYILALVIAIPSGLAWWFWSWSAHGAVVEFAVVFFPAIVTFLIMAIVAGRERIRRRFEDRLFDALDRIERKLDKSMSNSGSELDDDDEFVE